MARSALTASESSPKSLTFTIPVDEYRSIPIPGFANAKLGTCYVRVTDLPSDLDDFMRVNPRVPNRTDSNRLSGPVPKAILQTLRESPEDMALKNAGIFFLVASAEQTKGKGGVGLLNVHLDDADTHGIVNGGHTYAAIQQAREDADEEELRALRSAFVRLHFLKGVPEEKVVEIAEGLNRSKQVQIPSLENLKGSFDIIKNALLGKPGADQIAYREGDPGDVYIGELISFIEMFNLDRYGHDVQPHDLYSRQYKAIAEFGDDLTDNKRAVELIVSHLPEILLLADKIRRDAPIAAKSEDVNFEIGRMKVKPNGSGRVASPEHKNTPLHFLGEKTRYRLPNAWLFPMLAAFRANVEWDSSKRLFRWRVPNDELLAECLPKLVSACVREHRNNRDKPEWVGKKDSAYEQCSLHIRLYLAERRRN
ncbi:MAG: AIPR family protein [Phycisphaerales bacterium]|nr:AIPR family protein [Phycisphaerales bacterium]